MTSAFPILAVSMAVAVNPGSVTVNRAGEAYTVTKVNVTHINIVIWGTLELFTATKGNITHIKIVVWGDFRAIYCH